MLCFTEFHITATKENNLGDDAIAKDIKQNMNLDIWFSVSYSRSSECFLDCTGQNNLPTQGADCGELFVREMMSASHMHNDKAPALQGCLRSWRNPFVHVHPQTPIIAASEATGGPVPGTTAKS